MTITSIRQINNNADFILLVMKDRGGTRIEIPANTSRGTDIWIPWCNTEGDFNDDKRLDVIAFFRDTIFDGSRVAWWLFYLWQRGDQIFFSKAPEEFSQGRCVPTLCSTGGDRLLIIDGATTGGPVTGDPAGGRVINETIEVRSLA